MPMPHALPYRLLFVGPLCARPSAPSWMALDAASRFSRTAACGFFDDLVENAEDSLQDPETRAGALKPPHLPESLPAAEAFKTLQSNAFYRPETFVRAVRSLDAHLLHCRHRADLPVRFKKNLLKKIDALQPHLVLLAADSVAQRRRGLEVIRLVRSVHKHLPAFLVCGPRVQSPSEPDADAVIEYEALQDRLTRLFKDKGPEAASLKGCRDPGLFPRFRYAVPDPVLDLNGLPEKGLGDAPWLGTLDAFGIKGVLLFELESPALPEAFLSAKKKAAAPWAVGLRMPLDAALSPEDFQGFHQNGVRLMLWHLPSDSIEAHAKTLFQAKAAGIWNHLAVEDPQDLCAPLLTFIAANPHLIHSWGVLSSEGLCLGDLADKTPSTPYERITPLPGVPFWHFLADPVYLLLYLHKHGPRKVMRWRVKEDGTVYCLGQGLTYHFVKPEALPPGYLDILCKMVEAGGSVDTRWVRHHLERAFLIAYAEEEGILVANSCLKHPRKAYLQRLGRKTGFDFTGYLERGYTSVRPEYRGLGIGTKLLEGLTARVGDKKLFSIIGEDNIATQKMALRNRTRKVGTFFSDKAGTTVGVWVPEWMLNP